MNYMDQDYYITNTFSKFIEISGKDSSSFLQALITNDINKCHENRNPIYSCFFIIKLEFFFPIVRGFNLLFIQIFLIVFA